MFTELTDDTYSEAIANSKTGIVLCKKKLCPHCKNMAKVVEKFSAKISGLDYFTVDSQDSEKALAGVGAERVPTICIIKNGKISARKVGLMNPQELEKFFRGA